VIYPVAASNSAVACILATGRIEIYYRRDDKRYLRLHLIPDVTLR